MKIVGNIFEDPHEKHLLVIGVSSLKIFNQIKSSQRNRNEEGRGSNKRMGWMSCTDNTCLWGCALHVAPKDMKGTFSIDCRFNICQQRHR